MMSHVAEAKPRKKATPKRRGDSAHGDSDNNIEHNGNDGTDSRNNGVDDNEVDGRRPEGRRVRNPAETDRVDAGSLEPHGSPVNADTGGVGHPTRGSHVGLYSPRAGDSSPDDNPAGPAGFDSGRVDSAPPDSDQVHGSPVGLDGNRTVGSEAGSGVNLTRRSVRESLRTPASTRRTSTIERPGVTDRVKVSVRIHALSIRLRWILLATTVVLIVGGTWLMWWRLGSTTRGTMWAEDANIFVHEAFANGPLTNVFQPYAGYLQFAPRLIAAFTVTFVPIQGWALSMAFGSCLVAAGAAAVTAVCARQVLRSLPLGIAAALLVMLDPLAPHEVLGNTANLHWYAVCMAPWMVLYRPRTRAGLWTLTIIMACAGLSEIQLTAFIPLALWRWRDPMRRPIRLALILTMAIQIIVTIIFPRPPGGPNFIGVPSLIYGYLINCVATIFQPNVTQLGIILHSSGALFPAIMLVPFVLAFAYCLWRGRVIDRLLAVTFFVGSMALYVIAIEINRSGTYDYTSSKIDISQPGLARYGVVPSIFLLCLLPLTAAVASRALRQRAPASHVIDPGFAIVVIPPPPPSRKRAARVGLGVVVVTLLVTLLHLHLDTTTRTMGPTWVSQINTLQSNCAQESPDSVVHLVAQPQPTFWYLRVTCRTINGK